MLLFLNKVIKRLFRFLNQLTGDKYCTGKYSPLFPPLFSPLLPSWSAAELSMDEFYIVNNIYVNKSASGRIQEWVKPFASVEERK